MNLLEMNSIIVFSIWSLLIFVNGVKESIKRNNPYKTTPYLSWMGIFVWGDAVIIGFFWFVCSLVTVILKDRYLFFLIISVFWVVRSLGETIYWLNQQLSTVNRNPPQRLVGYRYIKNSAIWFVYQIFWQCITVISMIASIYFTDQWLGTLE